VEVTDAIPGVFHDLIVGDKNRRAIVNASRAVPDFQQPFFAHIFGIIQAFEQAIS
jgi:hypothetical protein